MSAPPYMRLFTSDFLASTRRMTGPQQGAYLRLLVALWENDGCLPDDDTEIAAEIGYPLRAWLRLRAPILKHLEVSEGRLSHAKLVTELCHARDKQIRARISGAAGGRENANRFNAPEKQALNQTLSVRLANGKRTRSYPEPEPKPDVEISLPPEQEEGRDISTLQQEEEIAAWRANAEAKRLAEWKAAVVVFNKTGLWRDSYGPKPGEPECRAPPEAFETA